MENLFNSFSIRKKILFYCEAIRQEKYEILAIFIKFLPTNKKKVRECINIILRNLEK